MLGIAGLDTAADESLSFMCNTKVFQNVDKAMNLQVGMYTIQNFAFCKLAVLLNNRKGAL
jgi:hypothetical protein